MIRLSRLADYAVTIMCKIAKKREEKFSASVLSKETNIGESTVMKILKLLANNDLLISSRGVKGGYVLHKDPKDISILSIVNAIDGNLSITLCNQDNSPPCEYEVTCEEKCKWEKVNQALIATLSSFSLEDFAKNKEENHAA